MGDEQGAGGADEMAFVFDVPVTLRVMMGDATITIGDVLKCGKGSVIPLNQKIGDPFVVLLQNRPIAEGEVVEVEQRLGIKITKVLKNTETDNDTAASGPA